jgi:hypothetical protein
MVSGGNPIGAVVGGAVGVLQTTIEVMSELNTNAPELAAAIESAKENLTNFDSKTQLIVQTYQTYQDALNNGAAKEADVNRARDAFINSLNGLDKETRNKIIQQAGSGVATGTAIAPLNQKRTDQEFASSLRIASVSLKDVAMVIAKARTSMPNFDNTQQDDVRAALEAGLGAVQRTPPTGASVFELSLDEASKTVLEDVIKTIGLRGQTGQGAVERIKSIGGIEGFNKDPKQFIAKLFEGLDPSSIATLQTPQLAQSIKQLIEKQINQAASDIQALDIGGRLTSVIAKAFDIDFSKIIELTPGNTPFDKLKEQYYMGDISKKEYGLGRAKETLQQAKDFGMSGGDIEKFFPQQLSAVRQQVEQNLNNLINEISATLDSTTIEKLRAQARTTGYEATNKQYGTGVAPLSQNLQQVPLDLSGLKEDTQFISQKSAEFKTQMDAALSVADGWQQIAQKVADTLSSATQNTADNTAGQTTAPAALTLDVPPAQITLSPVVTINDSGGGNELTQEFLNLAKSLQVQVDQARSLSKEALSKIAQLKTQIQ